MPSNKRTSSRVKSRKSKAAAAAGASCPDPTSLWSPQSNAEQVAVDNADALRQALSDEKGDEEAPDQEVQQLVLFGSDDDDDGEVDTSDDDRRPEWPSASDH